MESRLKVGDVFRESFSIWKANFGDFFKVLVVLSFPLIFLEASTALIGWHVVIAFLANIAGYFMTFVVIGVISVAVKKRMEGEEFDVETTIKAMLPRFMPLVLAGGLLTVAVALGLTLLVVPGLFALVAFCVVHPIIAVEDSGVIEAFSRSFELTRGHRWTIGLLLVLATVAYFGLTMTVGCAGTALSSWLDFGRTFVDPTNPYHQQRFGGPLTGFYQLVLGVFLDVLVSFHATLVTTVFIRLRGDDDGGSRSLDGAARVST